MSGDIVAGCACDHRGVRPDDLYGLPLDEFVPERGALAKTLRGEGRRDEAAEVAKLRKPSAAAWAVNQLVRGKSGGVDELFAAGDALRDAQSALLAGRGDGRALRDAGTREREAVEELVEAAGELLPDASGVTLERVADTLHAAALDEAARAAVREGRLERELRHAGLGLGEGADVFAAAPASASAAKPKAAKPKPASKDDRKAEKERAAAEKAAQAEREAERKRVRAAVSKAAKAQERAGHALRAAQERHDRAAEALEEAEAALEAARAKSDGAEEEHRRLRAQLDGL